MFRAVIAVEKFPIEQLDTNHSKDQEKEHVHDEDVEHIFEGANNTVEHSLERGNAIDHFQRPEDPQKLD